MLETLYKIPSRILAQRLSKVTPRVIGDLHNGFMKGRGIQEPIITAISAVQDAEQNRKPCENFITAIDTLSLKGEAYVEVNNRIGQIFQVKSGTGPGDPVSADNFNVATEPLNLLIKKYLHDFAYVFSNGHKAGRLIYADDDLILTISGRGKILL